MCNTLIAGHKASDSIHLILHQGNERGYHDGSTFHYKCRKLITQGFATSCGHKHDSITSCCQVVYNLFLVSLERIKAEEFFQFSVQNGRVCNHSLNI